ncbi:hypothetical protein [Dolichospermum flos-aquae]|uniref:Uncharacterized protein n=1 Tax=Dolichospermum flos-aquae CCAP 1403/13F TaxID=315271 RepID=A0A6H2BVP6_DOLFA|nr:hypothetical protein [Dolichospermum flos-aquae]QJB42844.1 hypothetical protein HGD76_11135 [Dolichospermum flos-aquae CCAP 1403/13F]
MSINFFDANCQSQTNQYKFGLCDDPNEDPAYIDTDIDDCSKWIAIVENNQEIEVIFTAGQTHLNSVIHAQQGFQPLVTKINNRQNLCPVSILKIRCACPDIYRY